MLVFELGELGSSEVSKTTMDIQASTTNRPYGPPSNVTAVLKRLRSRNLREHIDTEYLRDAGIPEGSAARTMFGLQFLGLVEGDTPTHALRSIATSTDEEYQKILVDLIRNAYKDVFEVIDPTQDSQERILNFFRRYTPASQRNRMVIFFLGMCREAGLPTLEAPRQNSGGVSSGPRPSRSSSRAATQAPTASRLQVANKIGDKSVATSGTAVSGIPPALQLLVQSLPPEGTPLTKSRRDQWLQMASATLAFVYPDYEEAGEQTEESSKNTL